MKLTDRQRYEQSKLLQYQKIVEELDKLQSDIIAKLPVKYSLKKEGISLITEEHIFLLRELEEYKRLLRKQLNIEIKYYG